MKKKLYGLSTARRKISLVLILFFLPGLAVNGAAGEIKTLTLKQAIEIALKNNQDLKQVSNQVRLGQISVKQRRANFYPDLSVSANSSQQFFKALDPLTSEYESDTSRNLNLSISTNLNLFNGFYDKASLQQSKFELEAARGNFSRSNQVIIFETLQRYIQVVTSKELIRVEEENLQSQRMQLIRIEDFYKAGRLPITDLHQQKAEISSSEYQLLNSKRNYEISKLKLLQSLGLEPDTEYQVSELDVDNLVKELETFDKQNLLDEAVKERPDVNAQLLHVQAAQKGIKAAKSGYWPRLSLFADLGTNYTSLKDSYTFSSQFFNNNLNAAVGLSLSIPIFDKGTTKNNVTAAKIQLENQQLELEKLENQVSVEVQQALQDYRTAAQQVEVAENQLSYSKAALESIEARYNVQSATMVELIQTRARNLESVYNRVLAKYNLLIQTIAVRFYTGDSKAMLEMINNSDQK